jgi:DNA-binding HxlR family transcriptional regulator
LGVTRFDQFQEHLGISRNILNQRLGNLTDQGVLEKVLYSDHPPATSTTSPTRAGICGRC